MTEKKTEPTELITDADAFFETVRRASPTQEVELESVPMVIHLRPLPAADFLDFLAAPEAERTKLLLDLVPTAVVTAEGVPIFQPRDPRLRELPTRFFNELSGHVLRMNQGDAEEAAEGND